MTIKNYLIFALLLSVNLCLGQQAEKEVPLVVEQKNQSRYNVDVIHDYVEKPPSFKDGDISVTEYMNENMNFPYQARKKKISGRVITTFVVEIDGSLSNIKVVKDIGGDCGKEAMRLLEEMPKWIPAQQNGHIVRCRYTLPILFRL
jgi:TonB family protein